MLHYVNGGIGNDGQIRNKNLVVCRLAKLDVVCLHPFEDVQLAARCFLAPQGSIQVK